MPSANASFAGPEDPPIPAGCGAEDSPPGGAAQDRAAVLLPLPLAGAYDYRLPAGMSAPPGSFVAVPLGPRLVPGVVWGPGSAELPEARLKPIDDLLDAPPLKEELRRFVDWVANYTLAPRGAVLRMAMSVTDALQPPRPTAAVTISEKGRAALGAEPLPPLAGEGRDAGMPQDERPSPASPHPALPRRRGRGELSPTRRRVLALAAEGAPRPAAELARAAGCGAGVVRALVDLGLLETVLVPARRPREQPDWRRPGHAFSPEQAEAAAALAAKARTGGFSVTLLDGVTGSGKTEVYFEAVAAALQAGKQVLVLLPEIALGAQFLGRFARRFGAPPAEWHSDLSASERRQTWRDVAEGGARVVVGARSALFLPFPDLGLVVVDEEHEGSYKQEDVVAYHARDMAVVRGSIEKIPVVLVSATPSLETVVNVQQRRYAQLHLPARHGGALLPEIRVVDLRREKPERQRFLAPPLVKAVEATLEAGEQALLFLNRRGYAPLTLCRACGHRLQCPNCTTWLVEHRFTGRLQCHHCGHAEPIPPLCPNCGEPGTLAACGPGVERLAEEVAARFPAARAAVMASDTLSGPREAAALVDRVQRHEIDILIGTQIVAKGHHFPMLTLVGVVDADLGLAGGDLRAAERTYQLLHQVAGRAGREERPGRVFLQTFMPEHPVIAALVKGDRDGFLAAEAEQRLRFEMPPFGRLAALIVSAPDDTEADFVAQAFARAAPRMPGLEVLGPAPAPLAVLRQRHRRRFLVKARRSVSLQAVLRDWLGRVKVPGTTRVYVDIDPYSFL